MKKHNKCAWISASTNNNLNSNFMKEELTSDQIICKSCGKIVTTSDINKGLFMKVKEGGVIHWNCDEHSEEEKTSWSRGELLKLIQDAINYGVDGNGNLSDNWIKENL